MNRVMPSSTRVQRNRRGAFSLVELLVVVGIIALLIAILIPSISAARRQVKVSATQATLGVLDTGISMYQADQEVGGSLPPSSTKLPYNENKMVNPHDSSDPLRGTGAYFLAWALVGADQLGTPGFIDLNGNGYWLDDVSSEPGSDGLYEIANNQPKRSRSGPFVDVDRISLPDRSDQGFVLPNGEQLQSIAFLDSFDQPILYYKANTGQSQVADLGQEYSGQSAMYVIGDNAPLTGIEVVSDSGIDLGAGKEHPLGILDSSLGKRNFIEAIYNPNASNLDKGLIRPYRPDSYLLISAGPDGLYGTADDIANYDVNE